MSQTQTTKKKYPSNRYKEKTCPVCGIKHKKRWPCCSYDCSTVIKTGAKRTEEQKQRISEGTKRWKQTEIGQSTNMNLVTVWGEDDMILPPTDVDKSYFVEDGDVWDPI